MMNTMTLAAIAAALTMTGGALGAQDGRPVPGTGVIDMPGTYILQGDRRSLTNDRATIQILSNDVTLDLNGFGLSGPGGKMGVGLSISGVRGVRVMNGIISNTAFGVWVNNSSNVVLTDLLIRGEGLPIAALPPETGIMIVQSRNVVVANNAIYNTGLGIFVRGGRSGGNRIAHNTITAGTNGALGICYNPADGDPNGPTGDLVYGNVVSGFGTGIQASPTSRNNVFSGNTLFFRGGAAVEILNPTNMDTDNTKVDLSL